MRATAIALAIITALVVLGGCDSASGLHPGAQAGPTTPSGPRSEPKEPTKPPPTPSLGFAASVTDQSYLPDRAILPLVLPAASGGDGTLTYSLSPQVPGLTFAARSRTLTGTPTQTGEYAMTYAARDEIGATAERTFIIYVDYDLQYFGGDQVFFLNPDGDALDEMDYALRLGDNRAHVYLIASNGSSSASRRTVANVELVLPATTAASQSSVSSLPAQPRPTIGARPAVSSTATNTLVAAHRSVIGSGYRSAQSPAFTVGNSGSETKTIQVRPHGTYSPVSITVTVRARVTDGETTAKVWVDNQVWACGASQCVNQELVTEFADQFLRPGPANDVYDLVTATFGAPWGPHSKPHYITAAASDTINIVMYKEDRGGYFDEEHFLRRDRLPGLYSSEQVMFVVDSSALNAGMDDAVSTAAHEFQHVIDFYQRFVLRDVGGEVDEWVAEMNAMVAQDLTVPGTLPHLLSTYNLHNDIRVSAWGDTLTAYAINYALGAYLVRNYGAELFSRIMQSGKRGVGAVEQALRELGHQVTFPQILANWAVAGLLSDNTAAPVPYRYNAGGWITTRAGGTAYRLRSINLYDYRRPDGQAGPYLRDLGAFNARRQPPHSNKYAALGRLSGSRTLTVNAPAGVRFVVVFKE